MISEKEAFSEYKKEMLDFVGEHNITKIEQTFNFKNYSEKNQKDVGCAITFLTQFNDFQDMISIALCSCIKENQCCDYPIKVLLENSLFFINHFRKNLSHVIERYSAYFKAYDYELLEKNELISFLLDSAYKDIHFNLKILKKYPIKKLTISENDLYNSKTRDDLFKNYDLLVISLVDFYHYKIQYSFFFYKSLSFLSCRVNILKKELKITCNNEVKQDCKFICLFSSFFIYVYQKLQPLFHELY